ncbi:MAG: hypothetical protein HYR63_20935 [Proteobacteria bacterium]|nr:hypothetical protein [Pseudomonadota bacterium]MBI3496214.1 hypothetical protein [Pseudomonadota bacterium]
MRLSRIAFSQSIRYLSISTDDIYRLIGTLKDKYSFLEGPQKVKEYDLNDGINLYGGTFIREFRVSIDKCAIFTNGLVVETQVPVETADQLIDEISNWLFENGSATVGQWEKAPRSYFSRLEVEMNLDWAKISNQLDPLTSFINERLATYGNPPINFGLVGMNVHADVSQYPYPRPFPFSLTRRENAAYGDNIYNSASPLQTADHMNALELMERTYGA